MAFVANFGRLWRRMEVHRVGKRFGEQTLPNASSGQMFSETLCSDVT